MDARRTQEALRHLSYNDPQAALRVVNEDAARGTDDVDAAYVRSVAYFRLKDFAEAERHARTAVSLDPTRADAFYYLGLSLERQDRAGEALAAYRVVHALDPGHAKARDKLGVAQATGASTPAPPLRNDVVRTELTIPTSEPEFAAYEEAIRRKKAIDFRAEYDARLRQFPGGIKAIKAMMLVISVISLLVVAIFAWVLYGVFATSDVQQQQRDLKQLVCQQAREQGVQLPGC